MFLSLSPQLLQDQQHNLLPVLQSFVITVWPAWPHENPSTVSKKIQDCILRREKIVIFLCLKKDTHQNIGRYRNCYLLELNFYLREAIIREAVGIKWRKTLQGPHSICLSRRQWVVLVMFSLLIFNFSSLIYQNSFILPLIRNKLLPYNYMAGWLFLLGIKDCICMCCRIILGKIPGKLGWKVRCNIQLH